MKTRRLMLAGVMVLLVGCKKSAPTVENVSPSQNATVKSAPPLASQPQPTVAPPTPQAAPAQPLHTTTEPQFGWDKYDEENFAIAPSQGRFFLIPRNASQLRVEISATLPVLAGVISKESIKNKGVVNASNFAPLPCAFVNSATGQRECSLDPKTSDVFLLRDERVAPPHPVVQGAAPNKLVVRLYAWVCAANCGAVKK